MRILVCTYTVTKEAHPCYADNLANQEPQRAALNDSLKIPFGYPQFWLLQLPFIVGHSWHNSLHRTTSSLNRPKLTKPRNANTCSDTADRVEP